MTGELLSIEWWGKASLSWDLNNKKKQPAMQGSGRTEHTTQRGLQALREGSMLTSEKRKASAAGPGSRIGQTRDGAIT